MTPGRNDRYPDPESDALREESTYIPPSNLGAVVAAEKEHWLVERADMLRRMEEIRRELHTERLRNERLTDLLCETLSPLRVASGLLEPLAKYVEQIEVEIAR